jgi:hypothetical protein
MGRRRITLHEFPAALFAHLWPNTGAICAFENDQHGKATFVAHLSALISPQQLAKTTAEHMDQPNCGDASCEHFELVMITPPAKVKYDNAQRKLTICCCVRKKTFDGDIIG